MSTEKPPPSTRVSELGQWVYCNLAWQLQRNGAVPTPEAVVQAEAGRAWHEDHGRLVAQSFSARRLRNSCLVLAAGVAGLLAVVWLVRP